MVVPPWEFWNRCEIWSSFKVAQNSFQLFDFDGSNSIATLYRFMLQSCYQKTSQPLVNKFSSFLQCNTLPWQQYDLLKTPLITALEAYNSKMAWWSFLIWSSFDKHDNAQFLAKFKKILLVGFWATLLFWNLRWKAAVLLLKPFMNPRAVVNVFFR